MSSMRRLLFAALGFGASAFASGIEARVASAIAGLDVTNLADVRGHLHLPSSIDGLDVQWTSSDTSIISHDGLVTRPNEDEQVVLLAKINHDGQQQERNLTASVRRRQLADPFEAYMFAYFTGNSLEGENIFFVSSNGNDALSWRELNNGQAALTSNQGTRGLRDPFIIRSPEGDKFFLIATDLSIGSGTSWGDSVKFGSRYLEIWESNDLVNWSEQRHVLVSPPEAGNTWAPEAHFDSTLNEYIVYWASSFYSEDDPDRTGATYHRMLYATTRDFVTFGPAQVWQDSGKSRIDSTVLETNGKFYRFTKDEGGTTSGCVDIIQETSTDLRASLSSWSLQDSCIGRDASTSAVEGATAFKSNPNDVRGDKSYLFVDEYGGRGYVPLETENLDSPDWKLSSSYSLPRSPRHGTVMPITSAELERLNARYAATTKRSEPATKKVADRSALQKRDNPALSGLYADPNGAVFGNNYYIYATTDGFPGWGGNEFYVWKSADLSSWTRAEEPFLVLNGTSGNVPWAIGNAWAPTITSRNGRYYFYFSGHNPTYDRKTIGVAVADNPEGPFAAQQEAMILNNEEVTSGQAIDPCAFLDPQSGRYYLLWGNGKPLIAELGDDMVLLKAGTIKEMTGLSDYREGSFLVFREGVYHLTYSIDDTGSENYRVGYATSSSIDGPWTYRGVVLSKDTSQGILGTGHNAVINVPGSDEWYIIYHRFHIPGGDGTNRETCIDHMYFGSDGLIQTVVPTLNGVAPRPLS